MCLFCSAERNGSHPALTGTKWKYLRGKAYMNFLTGSIYFIEVLKDEFWKAILFFISV